MRRIHIPAVVSAVAVIAALYGWAVVASTPFHPGAIGIAINALGVDWTVFYSAVQWFFDGKLGILYDGDQLTAYRNAAFANWLTYPNVFVPWVYPPTFLLALLPFGALPFVASYVAFQVATAALLGAALYYDADRPNARTLVVAAALLGPAAAMNVAMGQNAFLTAALLVAGFRVLRTRPALGGAILGMLTMKPQFWILVPLALAAAREWRALTWSIIAATVLALASAAVFGIEFWRQWLDLAISSYWTPSAKWVGAGRMWGTSVFAGLVADGASGRLADVGQSAASVLAAGLVYLAFRVRLAGDRKIAVLLAATILAAPHSSQPDLVLLATAAALWSSDAAQGEERLAKWTLALAVWLIPLFNPPVISPLGRLTPVLILAFIGMTIASAGRVVDADFGVGAGMRPPGSRAAEE